MNPTIEQFKAHAHRLALTHEPVTLRTAGKEKALRRHVSANVLQLRAFVEHLRASACAGACAQPAEEWLLDHAEFIEEQVLDIADTIRGGKLRDLPFLLHEQEFRTLALCRHYLELTEGRLEPDLFYLYVGAYQEVNVLQSAELWTMPMLMRIAIVQRLAELMEDVRDRGRICAKAERIVRSIPVAERSQERLASSLSEAGIEIPLSGAVTVHLIRHLREEADEMDRVRDWLMCMLEHSTERLEQIVAFEHELQADWQSRTGHLINGLRVLSRLDWPVVYETLSPVEQTLRLEATGDYERLDYSSRQVLHSRIATLAKKMRVPERLIAEHAVELARHAANEATQSGIPAAPAEPTTGQAELLPHVRQHAASQAAPQAPTQVAASDAQADQLPPRQVFFPYYLLEPAGVRLLRRSLLSCSRPRSLPGTSFGRRPEATYFNMLAAVGAMYLLAFSWGLGWWTWMAWGSASAILLGAGVAALVPIACEWAQATLHDGLAYIKQPLPLLRYDFSAGIPAQATTLVTVPVIWATPADVKEMLDRLELHHLATRDEHVAYALLGDYADSPEQHTAQDEQLLHTAVEGIARLNEKYPGISFLLLQRERRWNDVEQCWMGWERKRGKLEEFVAMVKGRNDTSFTIVEGERSVLGRIRYVLTLDADTQLPLGAARRMIGTMHLPYNRPRYNKAGTRITEGYGVLQPRIGSSHESVLQSRFAYLWAAEPGVDPYAFAVSDPYQDGFGQGIFTGKGIFELDAFHKVLGNRIPENRVLSHDLLEGGFLRTGLLNDIELIDGHPHTYLAYQKRLHRWVRGDWQLLPWLLPRNRDRNGRKAPVDLSLLTRWQIVDNLRRSLLPPALFGGLLLSFWLLPGAALPWLLLALATCFLGVLRQALPRGGEFPEKKYIGTALAQAAIVWLTLPFQTVLLLDAVVRTLYRLLVSKRGLLEWVSSAEIARAERSGRQRLAYGLPAVYVLLLALASSALFSGAAALAATGLVLAVLWGAAPLAIRWLEQPVRHQKLRVTADEGQELRELAFRIWQYFEDFVTEADNWLPPDNVQLKPERGAAHRTSPTNIGLYLTCAVTARDFGFLDTPGLIERLERTVSTVERMEKWEGHLFNWYDTQTLAVLPPAYVSTVDSGNLVGCLIAARQGLAEWLTLEQEAKAAGDDQQARARANGVRGDLQPGELDVAFAEELTPDNWRLRGERLLARMDVLVDRTDFRPLYDGSAKLLALGYDAGRKERDAVLYDLMASEARQASFLAIALGQVSVAHWHTLGRTLTRASGKPALVSWSGTMFEYLMPALLMQTYRDTIWDVTYEAVVARQIEYARQRKVPFGISESGYYAFDHQLNYQYQAFGVPGLGFKRGLEQELVISPYATIMALPYAKTEALNTLAQLKKIGAYGAYGYYEAVDYTARRLPAGVTHQVVRSFMAHHQGMSLLTIGNVLLKRAMTARFHMDKRVRAAQLLLQERLPARPRMLRHPGMLQPIKKGWKAADDAAAVRTYAHPHLRTPEVCLLSNGKLTTVVTTSGAGYSMLEGTAVTRWREDTAQDNWGSCLYIRDVGSERCFSPTLFPCGQVPGSEQSIAFGLDKAVFRSVQEELETVLEVLVSPTCNTELRQLTLKNISPSARILEVTTFQELSLTAPLADAAHPAFAKLFIRTAYDSQARCLVASRRAREEDGATLAAAHTLYVYGQPSAAVEYETDRARFIGRGRSLADPQGLARTLGGSVGSVADPAFAMRRRVHLQPGETLKLLSVTAVAPTQEAAVELALRFADPQAGQQASELAWTRSRIELRHCGLNAAEAAELQTMAGQLLYAAPLRKGRRSKIEANRLGQSGLWPYGISGDRPIVLVELGHTVEVAFARKLIAGHAYLNRLGFAFDLVLLNMSADGYMQPLQEALRHAIEQRAAAPGSSGAVQLVSAGQLPQEALTLLKAVARVTLRGSGPSLRAQLLVRMLDEAQPPLLAAAVAEPHRADGENSAAAPSAAIQAAANGQSAQSRQAAASRSTGEALLFANSWGGFVEQGEDAGAYRMQITAEHMPPAPWSNVLANEHFGTLLTDRGTGYTWWRNSRECKLTPWSNDPVLDPPGELLFIRDEESASVWSALAPDNWSATDGAENTPERTRSATDGGVNTSERTRSAAAGAENTPERTQPAAAGGSSPTPDRAQPAAAGAGKASVHSSKADSSTGAASATGGLPGCEVTHGFGYSRFYRVCFGIESEAVIFVPRDHSVKITLLTLHNRSATPRQLSLTGYAEWTLGVSRQTDSSFILSHWDEQAQLLVARNTYQEVFPEATALFGFVAEQPLGQLSWTTDRTAFIGRNGTVARPAALRRTQLSGQQGATADSCAAVQTKLLLAPGEQRTVLLLLGCEVSKAAAIRLADRYREPAAAVGALAKVRAFWQEKLGQLRAVTPAPDMNVLLNGWLLYQSLACRMWARTAFYQAGGAYGYRDQLQDALSLLHTMPEVARRQIVLHAAHQYKEGDVQHWWHEETGRGIRTQFSDDLLWLPYVVTRYIEHTADDRVLGEWVPYLMSAQLEAGEHERYEETVVSDEQDTIYGHCIRAIELALARRGEHELPRIGIGDWNDGMNHVGSAGRGESVWLAWFLREVLLRFAPLCEAQQDTIRAERYRVQAAALAAAANRHGWDGRWYRRAFTDGGTWLGAKENAECRIDAIAQSWSIISGGAPPDRAEMAMEAFDRELVDRKLALARLLTPAFDTSSPSPGYIQGYPPGIRENGAQYTHGVIWSIVAWSKLGRGDKAFELFELFNPVNHTRTPQEVYRYVGEPYVMAADVYTAIPHEGRAGWTWYTGAAGWMYQAGVEWILGIRREGEQLRIRPCVPPQWPGYRVYYRFGRTEFDIEVLNPDGRMTGICRAELNGELLYAQDGTQQQEVISIPLCDDGLPRHVYLLMG